MQPETPAWEQAVVDSPNLTLSFANLPLTQQAKTRMARYDSYFDDESGGHNDVARYYRRSDRRGRSRSRSRSRGREMPRSLYGHHRESHHQRSDEYMYSQHRRFRYDSPPPPRYDRDHKAWWHGHVSTNENESESRDWGRRKRFAGKRFADNDYRGDHTSYQERVELHGSSQHCASNSEAPHRISRPLPPVASDTSLSDIWGGSGPRTVEDTDPLLLDETRLHCRVEAGHSGESRRLKSNCYQVSLDTVKCPMIYQHHVSVEVRGFEDAVPEQGTAVPQRIGGRRLLRPMLRQVVSDAIQQNTEAFNGVAVAYDGANALFTPASLSWPKEGRTFENVRSAAKNGYGIRGPQIKTGKVRLFTVRIKEIKKLSTALLAKSFEDPEIYVTPLIQALDVVSKAGVSSSLIEWGGDFYSQLNRIDLTCGRQLYRGHHQSLRLGEGALVLNLDRVYGEFYADGQLLDLVASVCGVEDRHSIRIVDARDARQLMRSIHRLSVCVSHRETCMKEIVGVSDTPAHSTMITVDGREASVADYFLVRYNYSLKYPELPPVNLGGRRPGSESWVPMELCVIAPGQPCVGTQNTNSARVRQFTAARPHERLKNIKDLRRDVNFDSDSTFEAFGLSIGRHAEVVGARVLEAPSVEYANEIVQPLMGSWNLARKKFIQPATLSNWGVVICNKTVGQGDCVRRHLVERFYSNLCQEGENCGMNVNNTRPVIMSSGGARRATIEDMMTECYEHMKRLERNSSRWGRPQLLLVIKPDEDASVYQEIKRVSHTVLGVPSQCITTQVMHRAKTQVMANICLKLNSKLGGLNSLLSEGSLPLVHDRPTIILGANVTYPRLESSSRPPVAAITASLDRYSCHYAARLAVQDGPNDFSHLPQMFWELFRQHYKHSRSKPKHVVYFRSGVASSRLHDVVQAEMRALRKAFRMLEADYEPLVTFIMASKSHHVRLFVPEGASHNSQDRSGNPVPGTIVDKGTLVDPQRFDFFLLGHSGIQGTSVPTRYTLLVDENKLGPAKIEKLTHNLCYSYARCTRSVSIVPPVYYAQLAADQALGSLCESSTDESSNSSRATASTASGFQLAALREQLEGVMYFV